MTFTAAPFAAAVCALLGYLDHRSSGLLHGLGDSALLFGATGFGAMSFLLPLRPIHKALLEAKIEACALTQKAIRRLGTIIPTDGSHMADATSIQRMRDLKRDRDTLLEVYQMYAKAPTWPFNLAVFLRITARLAGPAAVLLVELIRSQVMK